ncbi:MarR family transcriptional regulator [Phycicoccus sp. CSK15P-2]|uniref:MarR family winged helix-turn-helix transcriptional regulator n=1 Tax=Phycicoccus sp. CSK15P-2 TaxID=2807627 RepID=UPI00195005D1|nr:MarR family transcriptional regulator [Phycicoccus sp. CSK15P-2]MBM6406094.1 MarR family transcriptional regulator [Phycicoccus sp. CSK15P-2]
MSDPVDAAPRHGLSLEEQLCFSLYSASRLVTAAYRPILEELGLTYPQYVTMLVLWERAPVSMKALGEALGLDYGTVTPLVKRLETAGLVQRRRRTDDERAVDVTLTEPGHRLRERSLTVPDRIGAAMGLEDEDFASLKRGLDLLAVNVEDHLR